MSEEPDTAGHTITGDGTIPADATVETRDSEIAETVSDGADSHACEGCGQTFEEIGRLLDHDCEEDWDGPDPDDDNQRALADGGVERIETAEEFLEWSFDIRGEDCLVVTNDLSANDDRPDRAAIWAEEPVDVPEGVVIETEREADGTAPAVEDRDVEGWTKYELRLTKQALTDGGEPSTARRSSSELRSDGGAVMDVTAEEFQRLQNQRSTTDRDDQPQCENCGSIALSPKNQNALGTSREFEEPYQCRNCGEHVDGSGGDA